ncbi:glycosyltransferase [Synechococcus sp. UW140]|uniref:glycosyltransferase n=1 Tax=Synechococcus sp. UW140 TaxID=368503 RepID=UPI003137BE75
MMPWVSVVLPFRNARKWLPSSLASLLLQRNIRLELVAIDDGSTDGSGQLLEQIWAKSPWPLQLITTTGVGVSQARNLGWQQAKNELVGFLDADDLCLDQRLACQAAMLNQNPALQQVLCGWQRINDAGSSIGIVQPWLEGAGFTVEQALRHKAVLPSAWMLRRAVLERSGGFDPGLTQAEDVDLLCRLAFAKEPGAWLQQLACGYRIHPQGASQAARPQARSLLFVTNRWLAKLPEEESTANLAAEVRYATRAWAGWHAWSCDEHQLAEELWNSSFGMSPMPPALTWVHLAENVARSSQRVGQPFQIETLLGDPIWLRLEQRWLMGNPAAVQQTLASWRQKLLEELGATPSTSPWWPAKLLTALKFSEPLGALRQEVLNWSIALLSWDPKQLPPFELRSRLARILWHWAVICWSEAKRPTFNRLEQSATFFPTSQVLVALERVHRATSGAGAAALAQLGKQLPAFADVPLLSASPAFWEQPGQPADSCNGPQCPPCIEKELQTWGRLDLGSGLLQWLPPNVVADPPSKQSIPLTVSELPNGSCWIRPPLANPWGITHGLAVADQKGAIQAQLSRRYPQPWRSCPAPPAGCEPPPSIEVRWFDATVLAVADLSAEIYYHWLLENLPRIGLALESLGKDKDINSLLLWHNGGESRFVAEGLQVMLGLKPHRLIDARRYPHIKARRLLVPDFPSAFGNPSAAVQNWLRRFWLNPNQAETVDYSNLSGNSNRRLWLCRGKQRRRCVWGEAEALKKLMGFNISGVDLGGISVREQAQLLASAELVVAPHGAAMANLVFASKGTNVLELHQPGYSPPYFHGIAAEQGLNFHSCEQPQRPPALFQDLLWEGPSSEPIHLDQALVHRSVELIIKMNL